MKIREAYGFKTDSINNTGFYKWLCSEWELSDEGWTLKTKLEKFDAAKEVHIMSADKDFLQLVSNKVRVYSPVKKKIYKPKDVLEEFGVSCYNFVNYKILMGDTSDNLPDIS